MDRTHFAAERGEDVSRASRCKMGRQESVRKIENDSTFAELARSRECDEVWHLVRRGSISACQEFKERGSLIHVERVNESESRVSRRAARVHFQSESCFARCYHSFWVSVACYVVSEASSPVILHGTVCQSRFHQGQCHGKTEVYFSSRSLLGNTETLI